MRSVCNSPPAVPSHYPLGPKTARAASSYFSATYKIKNAPLPASPTSTWRQPTPCPPLTCQIYEYLRNLKPEMRGPGRPLFGNAASFYLQIVRSEPIPWLSSIPDSSTTRTRIELNTVVTFEGRGMSDTAVVAGANLLPPDWVKSVLRLKQGGPARPAQCPGLHTRRPPRRGQFLQD